MSISQLSLTDFRNLQSATLDFDRQLNLVSGKNGSGKTSLLEAIYVLCQARSFRTHQLKQCIRHDKKGFLLFGRFDGFKAGLSKNERKLEIRIDGEVARRRSELVRRAPVNIVNSDTFELISGAPGARRRFLDWSLFHVEHDYAQAWSEFQHALRQRNRLLKTRRDLKLLDYWDQHLLEPSIRISQMRQRVIGQLATIMQQDLGEMLRGVDPELVYRPGWPVKSGLEKCLVQNRERDIRAGFTGVGIHRDDLELIAGGRPAGEVLSRGQSKRLCIALSIGALKLVNRAVDTRIIMLIDDLHSELDEDARVQVYTELAQLDLQLFVTNINQALTPLEGVKEFKMFHVEHGIIKPRNFS